jgi:cytochrome c oxidase assembly protein subunit 15
MSPASESQRRRARRAGAAFYTLAGLGSVLVVLGALVRSHGAGLACPDWPLCFGQLIPALNFSVGLEFGHRVLAGAISVGLLAATIFVLREPLLRAQVRTALLLTWGVLAVQIVLGGLTVLLGLAPWTVTAHLLFGTSFCAALLWVAHNLADASHPELREPRAVSAMESRAITGCAVLVFGQIALGGLVSSHYAGLACDSFPSCDGESFVPTLSGLVGLQVLHRLNSLGLLAAFALVAWTTRGGPRSRLGSLGLGLVLLQIAVGAANVLLELPVEITALHSALALAISLVTLLLVREAVRARSRGRSAALVAQFEAA